MKKNYMKVIIAIVMLLGMYSNTFAQCTVTIAQTPSTTLCGTNATLTANAVGGGSLTIDQNQASNTTCMANFSQGGLAQSFKPSVNTMCGAGIYLASGTGTGVVTIQLYSNLPTLGGTVIATGTVVGSVNSWADVFFASPASVTPGTTYYLVLTCTNGGICVGGDTGNPYANGNVYANTGYNSFPTYDYTFRTYSGCNIASYLWSTGSNSAAITVSNTGVYTVTMTVGSCSTTASKTVTINSNPTITVNSGTVCSGQAFTISPSGASTYTIQGGNAVVTPTANSTYTVIGTSSAGCVSQSVAVSNITVVANPTISVNSGTMCAGTNFTLNPSGAVSYSYSGGSAVVSPSVSTSYSVTGTNSLGCVSPVAAISNITVSPQPSLTVNSGSVCPGGSFTMNPTGALNYTFSSGNAVVTPSVTSSYTVSGTNTIGCVGYAISNVTVSPNPTVTAVSNTSLLCVNQSATITANGATTYSWSNGASASTIVVSPSVTTNYTVIGVSNSCSGSAVVTQSVISCAGIAENNSDLSNVTVYPNPTNGIINVVLSNTNEKVLFSIFNGLGQLLKSENVNNSTAIFDLNSYPSGVYFVKLQQGAEMKVIKVIKE